MILQFSCIIIFISVASLNADDVNNDIFLPYDPVLPTKPTPNTLYSKVVRIGEYFEVDCGVTLGDVTVKEQCAIIRLRVNNDLMDSTSSSNYLNYTRTPTFKFPVVSKSDREYNCTIYFIKDSNPCITTDELFNGPLYKVYRKYLIIDIN